MDDPDVEFERVWSEVREEAERLREAGDVLVTPATERAFEVVDADETRVTIRYRDADAERGLWREQFAVLHERLHRDAAAAGDQREPAGLLLTDLPPGVEPYVAVLSLASAYAVDESGERLRPVAPGEGSAAGESPFRRPAWAAREPPERVRDDAVLLADLLARYDADDPDDLSTETLADLYVLLSDVQRGADGVRRNISAALLDRIAPDASLHGRFGTVHRTRRERRQPKEERTVLAALDERGIPHEWVQGIDPEKLDVVLAVTDLDEDEVLDVEATEYVQKTGVEEAEKRSHLQGLKDRLAGIESDEADDLRDEIETLESRLDDLLAAG